MAGTKARKPGDRTREDRAAANDFFLPPMGYRRQKIPDCGRLEYLADDCPFPSSSVDADLTEIVDMMRTKAHEYCQRFEYAPRPGCIPDPKSVADEGVVDAADLLLTLDGLEIQRIEPENRWIAIVAMRAAWLYSRLFVKPREALYEKGKMAQRADERRRSANSTRDYAAIRRHILRRSKLLGTVTAAIREWASENGVKYAVARGYYYQRSKPGTRSR